jgi:hypothetical protein
MSMLFSFLPLLKVVSFEELPNRTSVCIDCFLPPPISAIYAALHSLMDLNILILYQVPHYVTNYLEFLSELALLDTYVFLGTSFADTCNLLFSLIVKEHVSHPYRNVAKPFLYQYTGIP